MIVRLLLFISLLGGTPMLSAQPTISSAGIVNAASYAYPGMPNGPIAEGSIFTLFGNGVGPAQIQFASSFPLPTTLGGTSVSVTVNGSTLQCPLLYSSAKQVAAILPSAIPIGTGTARVTYNGATSNTSPITVVKSSPGLFTVNQQGAGQGAVQDGGGGENSAFYSFAPGQQVVIWGTGLGPIGGSDAAPPPSGNLPSVLVTASVGAQQANVIYAGRSQNAGEDQINVVIPSGVSGCFVPVSVTVANPDGSNPVTSNWVSIAVAASGKLCSDQLLTNEGLQNLQNGGVWRVGVIELVRSFTQTSWPGSPTLTSTSDTAIGMFSKYDGTLATNGDFGRFDLSDGGCYVVEVNGSSAGRLRTINLDAGPVINLNGPNGPKQLTKSFQVYTADLGDISDIFGTKGPLYLDPGTYALDNGSGGADVQGFRMNITVASPFTWTNMNSINNVSRNQPLPITWTGGDPNATVLIEGTTVLDSNGHSVSFFCQARDSAGSLTVPASILRQLPPSGNLGTDSVPIPGGSLMVETTTSSAGSAPGMDVLTGTATSGYNKTVVWQ